MVLGALIVNVPTTLADNESEPNDNFAQADPLLPMTPMFGMVAAADTDDYFEMTTIAIDQTVTGIAQPFGSTLNLYMYDETQTEVDNNMGITDPWGTLHHQFLAAQASIYIRVEYVSGPGGYMLNFAVLDDAIQPNITHTPVTTAIEGQEINITAEVTDNVGVQEVRLNYTGVDMVEHNETMTAYQDNFTYIIPGQVSAGAVEYFIWANDTSTPSLENATSNNTITITEDTELPLIDHTPVTSAQVDTAITIKAEVTDNVGLNEVQLNYTDVAGASHNETMTLVEGNYTFDIPAQTSAGTVTYFIWANDTNGNVAQTVAEDITISSDVTPPTISHTAVKETDVDESVEITATITDDVGVESATLYYRKTGDTTFTSVTMTKSGDIYTGTIPASAVTDDGVEYYISATDGFNAATFPATNPTTSPQEITIAEEDEFPWLLIIIALIIIIVVIVIVVAAAKRKGPSMIEEEEVEPMEEAPEVMPTEEDELS
jgi:hypothetical protein